MQVPSSGLLQRIVFHSDPQGDFSLLRFFMLLLPVLFAAPGIALLIILLIFNGINGS